MRRKQVEDTHLDLYLADFVLYDYSWIDAGTHREGNDAKRGISRPRKKDGSSINVFTRAKKSEYYAVCEAFLLIVAVRRQKIDRTK